jgi:hypothetical protein
MDILNHISRKRYRDVDDLLAFISIYDDTARTRSYRSLLRANAKLVRDAVCVEGGCGLGIFSVELARLGARKVYAVEQNPLMARLAGERFKRLPASLARRIELVQLPLQKFRPPEHVHLLVHEFYGQLLYDEDLWVLDHLRFRPDAVLPDGGELRAGPLSSAIYKDRVVNHTVIDTLNGVLVSGLFEGESTDLRQPVLRWTFDGGLSPVKHNLRRFKGDLLCLGLVVTHKGRRVCEAGQSSNWSYVWTKRSGDEMQFFFRRAVDGSGMNCRFDWKR